MAMRVGAASYRHIVDVDRQLHGMEQAFVDARALLALAGLDGGRRLLSIRGDLTVEVEPGRPVRLSEDEVAFFRSVPAPASFAPFRLAA